MRLPFVLELGTVVFVDRGCQRFTSGWALDGKHTFVQLLDQPLGGLHSRLVLELQFSNPMRAKTRAKRPLAINPVLHDGPGKGEDQRVHGSRGDPLLDQNRRRVDLRRGASLLNKDSPPHPPARQNAARRPPSAPRAAPLKRSTGTE